MNPGSLAPVHGSRTGAGATMGGGSNLELVLTVRPGLKLSDWELAGARARREHSTSLCEQQASTDTRLTPGVSRGIAPGRCTTFIPTGSLCLDGWPSCLPQGPETVPQAFGEMLRSGLWFSCSDLGGLTVWKQQGQLRQEEHTWGRSSFPGSREDQTHLKFGSYKGF